VSPLAIWRELPAQHRRYVITQAIIATAFVNLVLNAGIAWISSHNEDSVPLWAAPIVDKPSTVIDTIGTLFILPLVTCLIFTALTRRELRAGKLAPLPWSRTSHTFLDRLPRGTLKRGLALGAIFTVALSPLAVPILVAIDFGDLTVGQFVLYKAVFGVLLGFVVTPIVALWAIADTEPEPVAP
jgi:hypothetical protein